MLPNKFVLFLFFSVLQQMLQTGKVRCSNCVAEPVRKTRNDNNYLQRKSPPKQNNNKKTNKPKHKKTNPQNPTTIWSIIFTNVFAVCSVTCKYWDALTSRLYFCYLSCSGASGPSLGVAGCCVGHTHSGLQWLQQTTCQALTYLHFVILTTFLLKSGTV